MRLQLTVQRHALPPARILWTTELTGPLSSDTGSGTTISQLLSQINDIIPLESEEWGLEDYAVEVLKEDDEVNVRPLGSSDLRFRKISGRHQITSDGKHLIDGVAFGRPFLRRAERPAIRIPPRKRRRLTYDNDEYDYDESQRQLVLPDGLGDEDSGADSSHSSDEAPVTEDEEGLDAELNDIQNDSGLDGVRSSREPSPPAESLTVGRRRSKRVQGLGIRARSLLVDENGNPYPGEYHNPLLDMFADDEPVQEPASSDRVSNPKSTSKSERSSKAGFDSGPKDTNALVSRNIYSTGKSVRFDDAEVATPATMRLETAEDSGDDDFEQSEGSGKEVDESDKENAAPGARISSARNALGDGSDTSSLPESESDSDETSSSGSSDWDTSSTEDDDEDDHVPNALTSHDIADSQTSSSGTSSSSESSSSSEDEESARTSKISKKLSSSVISGHTAPEQTSLETVATQEPVPPGAGQRKTQKRNQRRKDMKKLRSLKKAGLLPDHATIADMSHKHTNELGQLEAGAGELDETAVQNGEDTQFANKRQALLQAISSGGVDVTDGGSPEGTLYVKENASMRPCSDVTVGLERGTGMAQVEKSASSASERTLVDTAAAAQSDLNGATNFLHHHEGLLKAQDPRSSQADKVSQRVAEADANQTLDSELPSAQKPRMRLDMESSRRLVFGALGQRTPKTKEDEVTLQTKLINDMKSSKKPQASTTADHGQSTEPLALEDDDSWKEKIELSAVECCHYGIELSTPPFPFVQRWDPQQKRGYFANEIDRSRNSKKRKRNNKNYEASFEPLEEGQTSMPHQMPFRNSKIHFSDDTKYDDSFTTDGPHKKSDENCEGPNAQLLRETEETFATRDTETAEDLPQLPDDLAACPDLQRESCVAGTIIAFKQLDMSAETNWAPVRSDYRTALIDGLLEDGTLSLRMALRDVKRPRIQYDEETGERLYDKFEMPGFNEATSEDDNGLIELAFVDLIDPKLVRAIEKETEPAMADTNIEAAASRDHEIDRGNVDATTGGGQYSDPLKSQDQQQGQELNKPHDEAELGEDFRKDISELIREAGWHSSIQSDGGAPQESQHLTQINQQEESNEVVPETNYNGSAGDETMSPRFDGFSSSSPAQEYHEPQDQVVYPTLRSISSPTAPQDETTMELDQTMADSSSQADREAVQALRADFEKEMNRPVAPTLDSDYNPESLNSSRPPSPISPPPKRAKKASISPLPQSLVSTIPDSQPPPIATTAPASKSTPSSTNSVAQKKTSSSSDEEFPDLETIFSSFASQRTIKPESSQSGDDGDGNNTSLTPSLFRSRPPPYQIDVKIQKPEKELDETE
ncbi:MAG: hypothetical protein Q9183_001514 [Haloplaca sp. 2 TL-2023]